MGPAGAGKVCAFRSPNIQTYLIPRPDYILFRLDRAPEEQQTVMLLHQP